MARIEKVVQAITESLEEFHQAHRYQKKRRVMVVGRVQTWRRPEDCLKANSNAVIDTKNQLMVIWDIFREWKGDIIAALHE